MELTKNLVKEATTTKGLKTNILELQRMAQVFKPLQFSLSLCRNKIRYFALYFKVAQNCKVKGIRKMVFKYLANKNIVDYTYIQLSLD